MPNPPSPRPLSIKVITTVWLLEGITGLLVLGYAFLIAGIPVGINYVFGVKVAGDFVFVYNIVLSLLVLYLAFGLWRLQNTTRLLGVVWQSYMALNSLLSLRAKVLEEAERATMAASLTPVVLGTIVAFVLHCLVIWFLITRKAAFGKNAQSQSA